MPDGTLDLMPDRKFWTISTGAEHSDEPYGVGLARSLYWPVWFKRNNVQFWLIFLEKFGMPTVAALVNAGTLKAAAAGEPTMPAARRIWRG